MRVKESEAGSWFYKWNCKCDGVCVCEMLHLYCQAESLRCPSYHIMTDSVHITFNLQHISRVLPQCNIKLVGFLPRKTSSFLLMVKYDLGLKIRTTEHLLWMWSGLHWADGPFSWKQGQDALLIRPFWSSTQYQLQLHSTKSRYMYSEPLPNLVTVNPDVRKSRLEYEMLFTVEYIL